MMEIIKTPWKDRFLDLVSNSKKSIKITSPYVKENVCNDLLKNKKENTNIELVTSFKLMNIYSGSVDLSGLENIIKSNGLVRNFSKLHAKIYLFDEKEVVISSSNLTNGGLLNNFEYGLYTKDEKIVSRAVYDFNILSRSEEIGSIKLNDIYKAREILSKIPKAEPVKLPKYDLQNPEKSFDIIPLDSKVIASQLNGWTKEVFICSAVIPKEHFSLEEMNQFEPKLKRIYPSNNNISAKIRQQLQNLRDLGLIEFLGSGNYKKLWK